jgi:hypothetical protein
LCWRDWIVRHLDGARNTTATAGPRPEQDGRARPAYAGAGDTSQ